MKIFHKTHKNIQFILSPIRMVPKMRIITRKAIRTIRM